MLMKLKMLIPLLGLSAFVFIGSSVFAASASEDLQSICQNNPSNGLCAGYNKGTAAEPGDNAVLDTISKVIDIMSYVAGILAVIMVIYGGFLYVTSAGEPQKAATGRQTIIYSLIGIVVVVVARQLILFVLDRLLK